ncbi:thiolase family protein [Dactylosporangium sp. NPDC005572]|uniref:thiolase family protein n=1 Tax=Dactylosporangium sp. NPDC005572 TaxID=3156889 RepID=UPI0033A99E87
MNSPSAVVIDAVRSPVGKGKPGGSLSIAHPVDLLAQVFTGLMARTQIDPALIDDVIVGCVSQVGEQSATPGRWAWLAAGLPEHTPAVTIDRRCGSGQQAFTFAVQAVLSGMQDAVVVGGVESMSRVPMGSNRLGAQPFGSAADRYTPGLVPQGISAELVAAKWGLTRAQLDTFSVRSHHRAAAATASGDFNAELLAITLPDGETVTSDETIRPASTPERLRDLPPAFESAAMADRFPQIDWRVTAGNSSQLADGAAALLVTSERFAVKHGLRPIARHVAGSVTASDPITMLTAPIGATERLLARTGMCLDDIEHYEVNEAFASVPLAWQQELNADGERLNPLGGAIALGHPLGASGARLLTTATHALHTRNHRYALVTMCEAGGMANATLLERL